MPSPALHPLFRKESFSPSERRPGGLFAPAGRPKPLPLGEVALRSNDGEGKPVSQKYLHSDKHWLLSERCYRCAFCFTVASLPSQSRSARRGRVAAPSVCFAVACILLAAAPTAPPCFRRWRRSSPLLPRGEPFHLHDTAPLRWNKWRSSYKLNDTSLNIGCSPTWRSSPDWRSTYFASWAQVRHLGEVCFIALVR